MKQGGRLINTEQHLVVNDHKGSNAQGLARQAIYPVRDCIKLLLAVFLQDGDLW